MIELRSTQQPVRIVLPEFDPELVRLAYAERERHKRWLRRRRPGVLEKERAYHRARRARPGVRESDLERKRKWRAKNRKSYNAYYRNYDQLTPGRRAYKAMKAREYRAQKRAAA